MSNYWPRYFLRLFWLTGGIWSATMVAFAAADGAWHLSAASAVVAGAFFVGFLLIERGNDGAENLGVRRYG